jgi:hypothetical protein
MKIAIVTSLWGRPELTKIIAQYYAELANVKDIILIAAHTKEDYQDIHPVWHYVEASNANLPLKFTQAFKEAKKHNVGAVMLTGSDDLLSTSWFDYVERNYCSTDNFVLGLKDFYFYHIKSKQAYHWKGFEDVDQGMPIGAGRTFSKHILDQIDWKPWGDMNIKRGLDTNCTRYLKTLGIGQRAVTMADAGCVGVDIKSDLNLNCFEDMQFNHEMVGPDTFKIFGETFSYLQGVPVHNNLKTLTELWRP